MNLGTLPSQIKEKIERIKNLLISELEPRKIILFGSLAEGKFQGGFDIDLAFKTSKVLTHRDERKLREKIDEIAGIYYVDLVDLEKVDEAFSKHIIERGTVLYNVE